MRRFRWLLIALGLLLIAVWFGLPAVGGPEWFYRVAEGADGQAVLALEVPRPGLFVDVALPPGTEVRRATAGGGEAAVIAPWPGERRRVLALWRGPVVLELDRGAGPFDLRGRPTVVNGRMGEARLPEGWRRVGDHAGRLRVIQEAPVLVAVPEGASVEDGFAALVTRFYRQMAEQVGTAPMRQPVVVVAQPEPVEAAGAVIDLWVLELAQTPELAWWRSGLRAHYAMRLLDEEQAWSQQERKAWLNAHREDRGFLLVLWLDMSLRYGSKDEVRVDDILREAMAVRTNRELVEAVERVGSLAIADRLDRMLKGREPLPAQGLGGS